MNIKEVLKIENHAERVTEFINCLNITRGEFCAAVGITKSALSRYVNGKRTPTLEISVNIAREFGISIFDIWGVFKND